MRTPILVFAKTPHVWGEVIPWGGADGGQLIYLSPELEKRSQAQVNSTVAHEFAHALFAHGLSSNSYRPGREQGLQDCEKQADEEIKRWGYSSVSQEIPKEGNREKIKK